MNDLEPWKIWTATGVLVCAILLGTAARIRPTGASDSTAQASMLAADQRSPFIESNQSQSTEQYGAYSSYIPHRSFTAVECSEFQAGTNVPLNSLLNGLDALADQVDEHSRAEALDVARQILGNDSRDEMAAAEVANSVEARESLDITGTVQSGIEGPDYAENPSWVFRSTVDWADNTAIYLSGDDMHVLGQPVVNESDIATYNIVGNQPIVFVGDSGQLEIEGVSLPLASGVVVESLSRMYLQAANTGPVFNPGDGQTESYSGPVLTIKTTLREDPRIDTLDVDE